MEQKQTYITKMPDKAGAFLTASRIISENGGNIVRVNYNKVVDAHTLFIEVLADTDQHKEIANALHQVGYLTQESSEQKIILIVLKLQDVVGAVTPVLEVINSYDINVTYINSQENGTPYQHFKMGLMVENAGEVKQLLDDISRICEVKILEYDITEKSLDNTVFYIAFANEMRDILSLSQEETNEVLIHSNEIMQMLDERNEAPLKTFDYIKQFATLVTSQKGESFEAEITCTELETMQLYTIQPPCGSNISVFRHDDELLFVDSGFACYRQEMIDLLTRLFGDLSRYRKSGIITHVDMDHTGLLDLFDTVYMSQSCYENFALEAAGAANYREQNVLHAPYCALSKIISQYAPPDLSRCVVVGARNDDAPISPLGSLSFGGLVFDFYEGAGGHVKGETLIVCESQQIVFTGDIFVNTKGFSEKQYAFNLLAPYLMTSVNVDSKKAKEVREYVLARYSGYDIYPGHGAPVLREGC